MTVPSEVVRFSAAQLSHSLVEATRSLICVVDGDGRILLANAALERFTGRPAADLSDRFFWTVLAVPEEAELARTAVVAAMSGGQLIPEEVDWLAAGGVRRRVALHTSVLADDRGRPYATAFVGSDVTEQRQREALSLLQASTDPLTGVSNRRAVFEALARHLDVATGTGCGLLFCDVDHFKQVNDDHGHAAGDQLLIELATRLGRLAGPDDLVARLGGDEFVLLVPGADQAMMRDLTRAVEEEMRAPVVTGSAAMDITLSIGSSVGLPGDSPDELMARADLDMYGTKRLHRRDRARAVWSAWPGGSVDGRATTRKR